MAGAAIVVNIGEMIDLAIGTPEVGVVDFNMLQTVLHCLAQQLRILGKNVELRGSLTALPVGGDHVQTVTVNEYLIDTDKGPTTTKPAYKEVKDTAHTAPAEDTILVVERVKKKDSPTGGHATSPGPATSATRAPHGAPSSSSARGGAPGAPGAAAGGKGVERRLSLVTVSTFNVLENTVADLQKRVYGSMPKNEQILEEVRSQTNLKAITDMWTNLNVSSRLEAAENGITKLSSLVQDLIGETVDLQRSSKVSTAASGGKQSRPSTPKPHKTIESDAQESGGARPPHPPTMAPTAAPGAAPKYEDLAEIYDQLNRMQTDINDMNKTFSSALDEVAARIGEYPQDGDAYYGGDEGAAQSETGALAAGSGVGGGGGARPAGGPAGGTEAQVSGGPGGAGGPAGGGGGGRGPITRGGGPPGMHADISELTEKLVELEKRIKDCCDNVSRNYGILLDHINSVENQVEEVMRQQMTGVPGDPAAAAAGTLTPDLVKDLKGLMQLFTTVQEMQTQLKHVHETALNLAAEKEDRQHHINALLEQIELLKVVKMDREDMAEAMAEKADLRALARKVSHDQFEMACDDLSKGLEHAIGKLNMQEALWQQALDDIQREIETKLDKMELSPVKEFFYNKLKQLQENLKQMADLRREVEAAGTKRRLLRDVNCISCDAKAIMAMDPTVALPASKPLPPTLSMKPYLSYELDAIRKSQATSVPQRNMHDWETIDKQMMAHPKAPHKVRSETDKHLCNRYCGGSHTVTTPAQRVARLGHFIKQWGPEVLPLSSGLAAGDDGKMYKVTTTETASVVPGGAVEVFTPKLPKKSETAKPPAKPIVISAECRCLEGEQPQEKP